MVIKIQNIIFEMSELPELLASPDPAVRTRSIALLSSIFMTDSSSILNNFDKYYDFFCRILENRTNDSISFFTLNRLLCKSLSRINQTNLPPPPSLQKLFQYISEVATCQSTIGHVNAFVSNMFSKSNLIYHAFKILDSLSSLNEEYIPSIIKILSFAEGRDTDIPNIVKASRDLITNYIKTNPKLTVDNAFKCILSESTFISDFAANILNIASTNNNEVLQMLVPYSASIQNHVNFRKNNDLQQLYKNLSVDTQSEVYMPKLDPAPFSPLAMTMFAQKTFVNVDAMSTKKFLVEKPQIRTANVTNTPGVSLSAHIDTISQKPVDQVVVQKDEKTRGSEKQQPQLKFLKMFAMKKGGALGKASQKRYFEFYPSNRCLVWRQTDTMDGVKGIMFLDHNVKIEKNVNNLTMNLKIKEKTHTIVFENASLLEEWYKTLWACTCTSDNPSGK